MGLLVYLQRAEELKLLGTELYVVALEEDVDEAELQSIATYPPGKYLVQKDFYNDDDRVKQLTLYRICNLPDPTPAPPSKSLLHVFDKTIVKPKCGHAIGLSGYSKFPDKGRRVRRKDLRGRSHEREDIFTFQWVCTERKSFLAEIWPKTKRGAHFTTFEQL